MKIALLTFTIFAFGTSVIADSTDDTNLPSRPVGQTVAGVVLCGLSIPLLIIGAASWGTPTNSPDYQSGNYGLGRFFGIAGCAEAVSGTILLVRAGMKWRIRTQMEKNQRGDISLISGLLVSREF